MIPGTATFSDDGQYRYTLSRWILDGDPLSYINFVLLNPSTATATEDDPTIRRCSGFTEQWGYPSMIVTNLFAFRATDPKDLKSATDPIGPDNDVWLQRIAMGAEKVIVAWGTHGVYRDRAAAVLDLLCEPLYCLGITKAGHPKHPLYLPKNTPLISYKYTEAKP